MNTPTKTTAAIALSPLVSHEAIRATTATLEDETCAACGGPLSLASTCLLIRRRDGSVVGVCVGCIDAIERTRAEEIAARRRRS